VTAELIERVNAAGRMPLFPDMPYIPDSVTVIRIACSVTLTAALL
jgi:hypothetical protein